MHLFSSIAAIVLVVLALSACSECSDQEVEAKRLEAAQLIAVNDKARRLAVEIGNCLATPVPQRTQMAAPITGGTQQGGQQGPP